MGVGGLIGAGSGALSGSLVDFGIDDNFIRQVADTLQPNTSALFVLVRKVQPEKVLAELSQFRGRVLRSSLSPEQEARLQAALSGTAATAPQPQGTAGTGTAPPSTEPRAPVRRQGAATGRGTRRRSIRATVLPGLNLASRSQSHVRGSIYIRGR
jgi:hypothetical protein